MPDTEDLTNNSKAGGAMESKKSVMVEKEVSLKFKCPGFKGDEKDFEDWRMKIEGWMYLTRKSVECQGLVIVQGLEGKALSVVRGMTMENLIGENGAKDVLKKLDEYYKKERVFQVNDAVVAFAGAERKKGESVKEFILRFEYLVDECAKLGVTLMEGEAKGSFLMHKANITEDEKKMIMSACGMKSLDYSLVRPVMKRLFENKEVDNKDEGWYGRSSDRRTEFTRRENSGREGKNPMRNGYVSKCVICSSEYHWANMCPRNMSNRGRRGGPSGSRGASSGSRGDSERPGTSNVTTDRIYMAEENEKNYWEDLEAILDSGCNNTVIGDI